MKLLSNRGVALSALRVAHKRYLWVALIPIVLTVIGQNYGLLANLAVAVVGYVVFFALYFWACVSIAKWTWRGKAIEYQAMSDAEKARVIGSSLWAG